MAPARALLLAALTVAAMATTTAAMAAPDTTDCAEATVRVDTAARAAVQAGDKLAAAETALADAQAKVEATTTVLAAAQAAVLSPGGDPVLEAATVKTASDALLAAVAALAAAADPGPLADDLAKAREVLADAIAARVEACTAVAVEPTETATPTTTAPAPPTAFFPNCEAVRLADADPLLAGEPGYRAELDADRDGHACEAVEGDPGSQVRIKPRGGVDTGGWPDGSR